MKWRSKRKRFVKNFLQTYNITTNTMPYVLRKYKKTRKYRVCKKGTRKCFSKKPMSKTRARKQLAAIIIHSDGK